MRREIIILVVFMATVATPVFHALAQSSGMKMGPGMGMRHWREEPRCWRAAELNLSSDQTKALEQLQQSLLQETRLPRVQLFSKWFEFRELLTNPTVKTDSIHSKYSEINELQTKLEERTTDYLIKVKALLTQEQLKQWCPEQEFPHVRRMMGGPRPMGPMHP